MSSLVSEHSLPTLGAAVIFIVAFFTATRPLWRYFYDPLKLRRFPSASAFAAMTPLWCAYNSWFGKRFEVIQKAHERLGPVVRISSKHLSFNDPEAIKDIYGHVNGTKVLKDEFYDTLAGEYHNIANVRDREDHARKRKYFSNAFALKTVVELEPVIHKHVGQLMNRFDVAAAAAKHSITAASATVDANKWLNYLTFDVIGEVALGQPFGFLENGSDVARGQLKNARKGHWHVVPSVIDALHSAFGFKVALGQLSRRWFFCLYKLLWWTRGKKDADMFTSVAIDQVRRRLERGPESGHADFFERVLLTRDGESRHLPLMELVSEAIVLLNAGSDTTSSSLTSFVYEVARNPEVQAQLQAELDSELDPSTIIATYDQVKKLPYLRACLDENLRLNPPIPYGPPRVVVDPKGAMIAGQLILPGTTVSVPTHSVHRDANSFRDPMEFRPERWLDVADEQSKNAMQTAFIPFSTGPRSCLGRNLAIMEQQVVLASVFHRYEVRLQDPNFVPKRFEAFNLDPGPLPVHLQLRKPKA
jgi:cytochrome P450